MPRQGYESLTIGPDLMAEIDDLRDIMGAANGYKPSRPAVVKMAILYLRQTWTAKATEEGRGIKKKPRKAK